MPPASQALRVEPVPRVAPMSRFQATARVSGWISTCLMAASPTVIPRRVRRMCARSVRVEKFRTVRSRLRPIASRPCCNGVGTLPEALSHHWSPISPMMTATDPSICATSPISSSWTMRMFVLDGKTGAEHFHVGPVHPGLTPALGDIDGDGVPEIVMGAGATLDFRIVAFAHDGTIQWKSAEPWPYTQGNGGALALADLDNDGDVEIIAGNHLFDHHGNRLWVAPSFLLDTAIAPTAADLDGDGDQEVIFGPSAYHHDGTPYYNNPDVVSVGFGLFPQVANLDSDPEPEVLVSTNGGMYMLEHDGTIKFNLPKGGMFPATVHDFDGDKISEFAVSAGSTYTVYEPDGSPLWAAPVNDPSGVAGGTAFDFLGDGVAEAMYADEHTMFVFDGQTGVVVFQIPRSSGTTIEYPTVADVDNDESAEIIVVSNGNKAAKTAPSVQVIGDQENRWIAARRIWNQRTYHVTNVREDGTIPQFESPHWKTLNTFRTNAQIEGGSVCEPPEPEG